MTEPEALALAQSAIPEEAVNLYTLDRDMPEYSCKRHAAIKRYYVGCGSHCYGNGDTWEEAVDELLVSAGKMKKAVKG